MKRMFTCSVGCKHAVEIERWENEEGTEWEDSVNGPIEFNVWSLAYAYPWRMRLKDAWSILRGRDTLVEGICLAHDEAQEMGRYLLSISAAVHPRDAKEPSVTPSYTCNCNPTTVKFRRTG